MTVVLGRANGGVPHPVLGGASLRLRGWRPRAEPALRLPGGRRPRVGPAPRPPDELQPRAGLGLRPPDGPRSPAAPAPPLLAELWTPDCNPRTWPPSPRRNRQAG